MSRLGPRQRHGSGTALRRPLIAAEDEEGHIRRMTSRGTIAVLLSLAVFLYLIRSALLPFVLAGAVAFVATPGIDLLTRRTRLPRVFWAISFFVVLVATVGGIGYLATLAFARDALQVVGDLEAILSRLLRGLIGDHTVDLLGQNMTADRLAAGAVGDLRSWASESSSRLLLVGWGFSATSGAILTLVMLVYFLIGGRRLGGGLLALVPPHQRSLVDCILERAAPVLRRYFIGVAAIVLYATCAAYIGLGLVLGLRHALLLAIITGLLEMIPVIGPIVSAVLAALVALGHAQSIWNVVAYIVYATLLRVSIDECVGPIVLGRATRIPAAMVIFCFVSGGLIFGITGIIMAVPVALTIKIALATLYDESADLLPEPAAADDAG